MTPDSKLKRKPWGWGPDGNSENPFLKLGKQVVRDTKETISDIRDEPAEVPYRIRERLLDYVVPRRRRVRYPSPEDK